MTTLPDFTKIALDDEAAATSSDGATATGAPSWTTPEGIDVKPFYTAADRDSLDFLNTWPGIAPYLRGPYPTMYVTKPWTIR
ncbi:MAG: methylmalonyl-CoA mutase, partial [Alphaproteobacteria bacterium]|nr:methylmalonyl-CoA mutase [Alphaproteobacteria bacterium]